MEWDGPTTNRRKEEEKDKKKSGLGEVGGGKRKRAYITDEELSFYQGRAPVD